MTRQERAIERLRARLAELDAELEASGIADALEWERFPEMERVMYALAERELELEWAESREVAEREETIALAEMAEEAALAELEVFGYWDVVPAEREGVSFELECDWILSGAIRDEREVRACTS